MKKLLLASVALTTLLGGSAMAADLPVKAPMYRAPIETWSWTGFYIGAHVGAAWGTKEYTFFAPGTVRDNSLTNNGFLGGAQVGFNVQSGIWLWGAEAQFSWSDLDGRGSCVNSPGAIFSCRNHVDWLGTVAGRLGFTADRALIFVKGGGAWVHDRHDIANIGGAVIDSLSDTRWGWMFGTGVEYAITGNWSAKVEYDYLDFGTHRERLPGFTVLNAGVPIDVDIRQRIHLVKFGVNYRFGWGPIVARF